METVNPLPGRRIIKRIKTRKEGRNLLLKLLQILCSPLLLFVDIFRARPSRLIFRAFLWFMLGISLLMATLYFTMLEHQTQLEKFLGGYFSYAEGAVPVSTEIKEIIYRNALLANVSPHLIVAVIQVESGFDPEAYSPKGACGLMQITPLVWQAFNPASACDGRHRPGEVDHGRDCIYNIEANIATGVRYLRQLIDYFDGETGRALEAYNAGLTNVELTEFRPKYQETRTYLGRLGKLLAASGMEGFLARYELNALFQTILRGLFLFTLVLWAVLLIWSKKHWPNLS
ncbi:MAG: lytic transglycosylase domain-containing protein [Firmicutes bacterium]|nr:lytic transglycosylase domain-containing protein [Bacillota bacterium]